MTLTATSGGSPEPDPRWAGHRELLAGLEGPLVDDLAQRAVRPDLQPARAAGADDDRGRGRAQLVGGRTVLRGNQDRRFGWRGRCGRRLRRHRCRPVAHGRRSTAGRTWLLPARRASLDRAGRQSSRRWRPRPRRSPPWPGPGRARICAPVATPISAAAGRPVPAVPTTRCRLANAEYRGRRQGRKQVLGCHVVAPPAAAQPPRSFAWRHRPPRPVTTGRRNKRPAVGRSGPGTVGGSTKTAGGAGWEGTGRGGKPGIVSGAGSAVADRRTGGGGVLPAMTGAASAVSGAVSEPAVDRAPSGAGGRGAEAIGTSIGASSMVGWPFGIGSMAAADEAADKEGGSEGQCETAAEGGAGREGTRWR